MKFVSIFKKNPSNESLKPFTYLTPSLGGVRKFILAMMVPQLLMLGITKSFMSLFIVLSSILASFVAELIFSLVKKDKKFEYLSPAIQGILIGLLIPSTYSPWAIFFIALFSLLIGKYVFGGFAQSWLNAVAMTVAVAYMLNMPAFSSFTMGPDMLSNRNAALSYIQDSSFHINAVDAAVTGFLNRTIFKLFGIVIPDGYVSFFWDNGSLIPAFRFNFITLISSIILMAFDIIDIIIPSIFMVMYLLLVRIAGPIFTGAPSFQGDMIFALLTSGTLFSTLYLLQWYGTTPITNIGKIIYGFVAGVVAFLVMGYGNSSVGYVFTILIMNLISTVIQLFESRMVRNKMQKFLTPKIQAIKEAENA